MRLPVLRLALASSAILLASACGGGGGGPDNGKPSDVYPAPHTAMPQVPRNGGSVAGSPVLVAVTYADDPARAQIDDFVSKIGSSSYWGPAVSEYGIGPVVQTTSLHLSTNAPTSLTDSAIDTDLSNNLDGTHPEWLPVTGNVIYLLFYPSQTTITGFGTSCQDYGAYHSWTQTAQGYAAYAVIPRCSGYQGITDLDITTFSASHEIVEAVTDPTGGGYYGVDANNGVWDLMSFGGELGDMCESQPDVFYKPTDLGYYVQRNWSNEAAAAGHAPCQPFDGTYFMAAPKMPDIVTMSFQGFHEDTQAVKIGVGKKRTIELDLYSDADTGGPFTVKALDLADLYGYPAELSFTFDRNQGVNGEKIHLTIQVLKAGELVPGGSIFFIETYNSQTANLWPAFVSDN